MPLIPLLLGLAPTVASWILGDKTGSVVEKVSSIAKDILGTADPAGIEHAISTDPNLALQFRIALLQAEADARRQQFDTLQAQLADVASARSQTVKLAESGSAIAWGAPIISTLITFGFFAMLYLVIRQEIPESSQTLANIMLGSLGTSFTAVVGYWVGSSAGSAQKTSALEKIARG
jgi:hypothetical protein